MTRASSVGHPNHITHFQHMDANYSTIRKSIDNKTHMLLIEINIMIIRFQFVFACVIFKAILSNSVCHYTCMC